MQVFLRKRVQGLVVAAVGYALVHLGVEGGQHVLATGLAWLGVGIMDAKGPISEPRP